MFSQDKFIFSIKTNNANDDLSFDESESDSDENPFFSHSFNSSEMEGGSMGVVSEIRVNKSERDKEKRQIN